MQVLPKAFLSREFRVKDANGDQYVSNHWIFSSATATVMYRVNKIRVIVFTVIYNSNIGELAVLWQLVKSTTVQQSASSSTSVHGPTLPVVMYAEGWQD